MARDAFDQEDIETFIKREVEKGRPVIGLYPPNDNIRYEYAEWIKAGRPDQT